LSAHIRSTRLLRRIADGEIDPAFVITHQSA